MASFTTVCLALVLLVASIKASRVIVTSNHFAFVPDSTPDLVITCTVQDSGNHDFAQVYELQLSRDDQIIALFNQASAPIALDPVSTATVTGDLSGTSGQQAYVTVSYNNPPAGLAGQYKCEAIGLDANGHSRNVEGEIDINTV